MEPPWNLSMDGSEQLRPQRKSKYPLTWTIRTPPKSKCGLTWRIRPTLVKSKYHGSTWTIGNPAESKYGRDLERRRTLNGLFFLESLKITSVFTYWMAESHAVRIWSLTQDNLFRAETYCMSSVLNRLFWANTGRINHLRFADAPGLPIRFCLRRELDGCYSRSTP